MCLVQGGAVRQQGSGPSAGRDKQLGERFWGHEISKEGEDEGS